MSPQQRFVLREQLIQHEGLRLKPYRCTANKLTIGVGRNLDDKGISKLEAVMFLNTDIEECLTDLKTFPWFHTLDPVRQRALIDFRFNVGAGTFRKFKKMIAALEREDFNAAADELLDSAWATQVQPVRVETVVRQLREGA